MTATQDSKATRPINGRDLLVQYQDEMIAFLVDELEVHPHEANLAITQLWDRYVKTLMNEIHVSHRYAEECIDAAIMRIYSRRKETIPTPPGPITDRGWHLMLHHDTRCYMAVCYVLAGRYVHHIPSDIQGLNRPGKCNDTNDGGGSSNCVCS